MVKVGDEIEVKILRVDPDERKIGLSRKRVEWAEEAESQEGGASASGDSGSGSSIAPEQLKGGVGSQSGPLIQPVARPRARRAAGARPRGGRRTVG